MPLSMRLRKFFRRFGSQSHTATLKIAHTAAIEKRGNDLDVTTVVEEGSVMEVLEVKGNEEHDRQSGNKLDGSILDGSTILGSAVVSEGDGNVIDLPLPLPKIDTADNRKPSTTLSPALDNAGSPVMKHQPKYKLKERRPRKPITPRLKNPRPPKAPGVKKVHNPWNRRSSDEDESEEEEDTGDDNIVSICGKTKNVPGGFRYA